MWMAQSTAEIGPKINSMEMDKKHRKNLFTQGSFLTARSMAKEEYSGLLMDPLTKANSKKERCKEKVALISKEERGM